MMMKRKLLAFSFVVVFGGLAHAGTSLDAIRLNKEGADFLKKQNFSLAEKNFIKALGDSPFSAELQLNLGLTYYGLGQMEKAQAAYEAAAKLATDDKVKFMAQFNLGELHQKAKKTDEALKYYQEALKYEPDSRETKVNIELLIQDKQKGGGGKDQDKNQDQKQQQGQSGSDDKDGKDKQDQKNDGKEPKEKQGISKGKAPKPQFNSKELTQSDVNKILGEINQQEQKIRAEFNRKDAKEKPRGKDW